MGKERGISGMVLIGEGWRKEGFVRKREAGRDGGKAVYCFYLLQG